MAATLSTAAAARIKGIWRVAAHCRQPARLAIVRFDSVEGEVAIAQPQFDNACEGIRIEQQRIVGDDDRNRFPHFDPVIAVESGRRDRSPIHVDGCVAHGQFADLAIAIVRSAARLAVPAMTASTANVTVRQKIRNQQSQHVQFEQLLESDHRIGNRFRLGIYHQHYSGRLSLAHWEIAPDQGRSSCITSRPEKLFNLLSSFSDETAYTRRRQQGRGKSGQPLSAQVQGRTQRGKRPWAQTPRHL